MPIQRFGSMLSRKASSTATCNCCAAPTATTNLEQVMCRNLLSVDWQGYLYDCDFNQQLGLPLGQAAAGPASHACTSPSSAPRPSKGAPIRVADHCYGCTAGQGSSCGGALGEEVAAAPTCGS
jgi:hypothetical protein